MSAKVRHVTGKPSMPALISRIFPGLVVAIRIIGQGAGIREFSQATAFCSNAASVVVSRDQGGAAVV